MHGLEQYRGECDRCGRDPGQGGVYPLDELDRKVCSECKSDLKDEIDQH